MHRFFLSSELIVGSEVRFPDSISRQLSRVLRIQAGEKVVVLDNAGSVSYTHLTLPTNREV